MVIMNLEKIFNPKSVALIGASDEEGSVGFTLTKNLVEGYEGKFYLVNIKKPQILGFKAYQTVKEVPGDVDLAVIATPAKTVPTVVEQCGEKNIPGVIIISAGFKEVGPEGKALEEQILEVKKRYNFLRIIGPNCLGVIRPSIRLNATFIGKMPRPGRVALISQSGAMGSAILDWAVREGVGFSNFVSVGSMIDVDFGDLIDYFGTDPQTRSILMYVEGVTNARKFMSAARHFARTKPIIVVKAGKFAESAKAAASHTGSLTGEDSVYEAAFKRAGIVRVEEIDDLFNCAEALGKQPLPNGPNLAIITNAGGPGIMATDALISRGGSLAKLSQNTMEKLNGALPYFWSRGNPIDILGDAKADRYALALNACLEDENVDGVLIIYTPQGVTDPVSIAETIVNLVRTKKTSKTILTSFMGYEDVEEANRILNRNNIPTYFTPEQAVKTYLYMYQYKRNLELLYETPEELPVDAAPPKRPLLVMMRNAAKENREILTELEAKQLLEYYGIPTVKSLLAENADEAAAMASQVGYPVVLKVLSPDITHKTDAGGVVLNITSEEEVRKTFNEIVRRAKEYKPGAKIIGVTVQPMVKKMGYEVILGAKKDPLFGPIIVFGMGGVGVELYRDVAFGLPPLNQTLARRIMEETKVYQILKGYRKYPPANLKLLEELMIRFSQMLVDFPQLKEVDINPLFIYEKEALALDARVVLDVEGVFRETKPHEHFVISPYPKKYETLWPLRDGRKVLLRPIKPEDEPLWLEMFQSFSPESIRYRFFEIIKDTPHEVRVRYCNVDYDRELAIVAELTEKGQRKIIGVARLVLEPDGKTGEIAFIVADAWQNLGLGSKLLDYMIEISAEKGVETIYGIMLRENYNAIRLMKKMGFTLQYHGDMVKATLNLKEPLQPSTIAG